MLEFMRKSANTIFIKAFLGLLILSFAAWGIGDIFRGRAASTAVATVGETDIPVEAFRAEFARELQRMSQIFGQEVTREQGLAMGIGNMLAGRLVQSELINEGAKDIGLLVSDTVVVDEIKRNPEFFNEAGRFDRNIYLNTLSRGGFTEDRYVARVRTNMARQQYLSTIRAGTLAPKGLVSALYAHAAEQRTAEVVRIPHAALKNVPTATASDLSQYHQDNAANFMAPEYRKITAVVLQASTLAKDITVTEDDIQAAYDEREAEYLTPETRKLRQVLVQDEASAQKAKSLLDGGKSIDEAAKEVGASAAMIDIGTFTSADAANLSPDIATAVFALAKGGRTGPLKSPLGWHVFEVTDIAPIVVKPLADVRAELTQAVKIDRALNSVFELSNKLEDLLGGGMTFEEAATALGLNITSIAAADAQGLGTDAKPVAAPYASDVVAAAFKLGDGQDSQLTETGDGNAFFVVRVDGVTAPALRPLDTVMKDVTTAWDSEKRAALANETANTVKQRLEAGETAADVAKALGFSAATTQPFTRDGKGLAQVSLPANVIDTLFGLKAGEVTSAPGTGAHTVARLATVTPAAMDKNNAIYSAAENKTLTDMQNDLLSQMSAALQGTYGVSINQKALNEAY